MNSQLSLVAVVILATLAVVLSAPGPDKAKLSFKVSARDLKDPTFLGKTDPYVKIASTENDGTAETKIGKSGEIKDNSNPDWPETFTFEFDRSKRQRWHFTVKSKDLLGAKENEGEAWVTVSDFVDNNGKDLQVNLNKKGYLLIKQA